MTVRYTPLMPAMAVVLFLASAVAFSAPARAQMPDRVLDDDTSNVVRNVSTATSGGQLMRTGT